MRMKPAHDHGGFVQGAWWPRTDQLHTELPHLLAALSPQIGLVDRVIFDGTSWASAAMRIEVEDCSINLERASSSSANTVSMIGEAFGALVLLVVPPYTNPARAYTAVMTASTLGNVSTPDELLGIGPQHAQDRRLALLAHQRWESEGGALRHLGGTRSVGIGGPQEVQHDQ
ncbi:hypothetical protein H7J70_12810 [Mycolicibacterium celeriflavum]|nr:hypothetical protein [Mycolicibacterium celeriflavum]ORA50575.1 hypothetical protein BST21_04440 [Mycolicibacterium celeriflavum]